jgi:hypothetical protein
MLGLMRLLALFLTACASGGSFVALEGVAHQTDPTSGWTTTTAPDGAYSFQTPGTPEALMPALADGSILRDHQLYQLRLEGSSRGFDVEVRPIAAGTTQQIFDELERQLAERWTASIEKSETVAGPHGEMRAISFFATLTEHHGEARIQMAGGRIFTMVTIYVPEGMHTLQAESERFFRSLAVK